MTGHPSICRMLRLPGILLLAALFGPFGSSVLQAQQLPQFALTPWSLVEMNPAATGRGENLVFTGAARRQWNALPGSPSGYHLSGHLPVPAWSSGFGLSLLQDQIGLQDQLELTALYGFHWPIGRRWTFHAGLAGGILQAGLNGEGIRTPDGEYPDTGGANHQDPGLPSGKVNATSPLLHGGLMLDDGRWEFGAAWRYAQGGKLAFAGADQDAAVRLSSHWLVHVSSSWETGDLEWKPTVVLMSDMAEWQLTTQCFLTWKDRIVLGGGFRGWSGNTRDALLMDAGLHVSDRFLILYAYESGLSDLRQVQNGSFELMIRYQLPAGTNGGRLPGIIYSPRFL